MSHLRGMTTRQALPAVCSITPKTALEMELGGQFAEKVAKTLRKFARKIWRRERGVFDRGFAKLNEINGFAINSRNDNDVASSKLRRSFRPFADFCRCFYFHGLEMALAARVSRILSQVV